MTNFGDCALYVGEGEMTMRLPRIHTRISPCGLFLMQTVLLFTIYHFISTKLQITAFNSIKMWNENDVII